MRRKLICGIGCFIFTVMAGLPADAPACHQGYSSHTAHHTPNPYESAFHKMDANHDGIVTQHEFVAAHQKKLGAAQAAANYKQLAARGGTTRRNGATGMTLQQFKAAHTGPRNAVAVAKY
jgi:hypothetical protein